MPAALKLTITSAGRAAIVNAEKTGTTPVLLSQVGLTEVAFTPDASMKSVPNELKRLATISGGATAADTIHVTIRDNTADTYSLRGLGLYLNDGTLFAVYSQVDAIGEKSAQASLLMALDTKFADINATSLTFGDTNFQLNVATTDTLGVVRLADDREAIAGIDTQKAMTPAATKAALDGKAPLDSPLFTGTPCAPTPFLFDNTTKLATTEFVQRAIGNLSGRANFSASGPILAKNMGGVCYIGANGITLTLPVARSVPSGSIVVVEGGYDGKIVSTEGDIIQAGQSNLTNIPIASSDTLILESNSVHTWTVIGGTAQLPYTQGFSCNLLPGGYQKLPSGLIIQWAIVPSVANYTRGTPQIFNFPIAFPAACIALIGTNYGTNASTAGTQFCYINQVQGQVIWGEPASTLGGLSSSYVAFGY